MARDSHSGKIAVTHEYDSGESVKITVNKGIITIEDSEVRIGIDPTVLRYAVRLGEIDADDYPFLYDW